MRVDLHDRVVESGGHPEVPRADREGSGEGGVRIVSGGVAASGKLAVPSVILVTTGAAELETQMLPRPSAAMSFANGTPPIVRTACVRDRPARRRGRRG